MDDATMRRRVYEARVGHLATIRPEGRVFRPQVSFPPWDAPEDPLRSVQDPGPVVVEPERARTFLTDDLLRRWRNWGRPRSPALHRSSVPGRWLLLGAGGLESRSGYGDLLCP